MPRVSQYRLAAHLSSAVVLYSVLFWNAKEILAPAWKMAPEKVTPALAQLRKMVISSKALVFLTLVSGAVFCLTNYHLSLSRLNLNPVSYTHLTLPTIPLV